MTDADVDPIRTLLHLLFPPDARTHHRGTYLHAQPPLYKVKKGKQEQYVKDDDALMAYLTGQALDGAALYPDKGAPLSRGSG